MNNIAAPVIDKAVIEKKIAEFLAAHSIVVDPAEEISAIKLLDSGRLDSLGIVQLTMFLADQFNIKIVDDDFVFENFATVGRLTDFVVRKCNS